MIGTKKHTFCMEIKTENIITEFSQKFNCNLSILENGEHYFHTKEQLDFYEKWIDKVIN